MALSANHALSPCIVVKLPVGLQEQQLDMIQKQVNKFRWKRKAEQRKRRLLQVFLRGDNIVTVTPVLHDVEKMWPALISTWRAAGMSEAALPTPAAVVAAQSQLLPPPPSPLPPAPLPPPSALPPPPPELPPPGNLGDRPAWMDNRR